MPAQETEMRAYPESDVVPVDDEAPPTPGYAIQGSGFRFQDWRSELLLGLGIVIALRVVLSAWAAFVLASMPAPDLQAQGVNAGITLQSGTLAAPWQREDALWYEKIATRGYDPNDGSTAFLPLLPLLMRLASVATLGDAALAGIVVSSLAVAVAFALFNRLAALDTRKDVAARAVLYLALFPTAFFLYSAFTESLFLALAIGAFWQARHGRWALVVLLALLAGLTKVQGALLCLPLAVEYLASVGWKWSALRGRAAEFASVVLAGPLGTLAFFAFTRYVVGDPMPWNSRVAAMWNFHSAWPGETLAASVGKVLSDGLTINAFDLAVLLLFGALAYGAFRMRLSYGLVAVAALGPSLLRVNELFPLMSLSRYALAAFPCFIVLAVWVDKRPRIVHLALIAVWLGLMLVWSSQFVRGFWVG
ncbi:MAG: mannosyltransferase family protein [Chloroflexia bacterium]